ncbi:MULTISPECIES: hypothetical protein [Flavobacteriaceae]|uniref:Uncharacterized protein n=2 Tax=Flavobacteriaceae TaxID=49546 RepID=A0A4Y8ATB7_9FLAO|nr:MULTISPECIES: hypothetical protein [Flavobacteriaceae]TEW75117.1 hypothetical protein E2488_06235 [Gramella jeungdoensis]GGK41456.1 hypothetical protein GCM10007963_06830 [Lutibacter litoralis]
MRTNEILVLHTDKGYVAIEGNQIFDLWKIKSLKIIYEELRQRYPTYKVHLFSMNRIKYQKAVEVSVEYLKDYNQLNTFNTQNINLKNNNKMKHSTFNTETAKTLAKVSVGFTTQKLAGALHLSLQTGADILQFSANTVANGEASILTKLKTYNEPFEDLVKIRQERTKGYQKALKSTSKKVIESSTVLKNKIENLLVNYRMKPVNQSV